MNLVFVTVPGLAMRSIEAVFVGGKLAKGLPPCHRMIPTDWVGHHHIAGREKEAAGDPMCHRSNMAVYCLHRLIVEH